MEFLHGIGGFLTFVQIFFGIVIGLYFWNLLKSQQGNRVAVQRSPKRKWINCSGCGKFP